MKAEGVRVVIWNSKIALSCVFFFFYFVKSSNRSRVTVRKLRQVDSASMRTRATPRRKELVRRVPAD